jgi:hypothetical protein
MSLDGTGSITKTFTGSGNPIQVSTEDLWVKSYMIQPHDSNLAKMYVGKSDLAPATKTWLGWLPIPTSKSVETFNNNGPWAHSFNLKDLYVSGDNGEGCVVTYNQF